MIINGVDYTFLIIGAVSVLGIAGLEYLICSKSRKRSSRQALLFIPFFILVAALVIYGSNSGGFLDLRGYVTVIMVIWALLCAIGQFIGWFSYKLKYENEKDEIPRDCPLSKE